MLCDEKNKIYQDDLKFSVSSWTKSQYISENSSFFDEDEILNKSLLWNMLENEEFQDFSEMSSSENSESTFNDIRLFKNNWAENKDKVLDEDLTEITLPSNLKHISILNNILSEPLHNEKDFYTKSSIWLDPNNIDREYSEYYLGESSNLSCESFSKIKLHKNNDSTLSDITDISDLNLSRSSNFFAVCSSNIERESHFNENLSYSSIKPRETLIQAFQKMIGKNSKKKIPFSKGSEKSISSSSKSKSQSETKKDLFENLTLYFNKPTKNFFSSQKSSNECSFSSLNENLEKSNINSFKKLKNPLKFLKSNAKQLLEASKKQFSFKKKVITQTAKEHSTYSQSSNFFNQTSSKISTVSQIFHDNEQVNIRINVIKKCPGENDLDKNKSEITVAKKFEINISIIS